MEIKIEFTKNPKQKPKDETQLGFGKIFTDHMFIMDYETGKGWHDPRIVPYGPIQLDPSAMCFHYGQEVFEGLKAYRTSDDKIQLFRPEKNMERLNSSNDRLCIPLIDEEFALKALHTLIDIERDWVPRAEGASLYIRPFIFAVDPMIGVHPGNHLIFMIILSPSGAYYPQGLNPVNIYVEDQYVRSTKGGMGYVKAGANYAASLKAQDEAQKKNYTQVLWLDGVHRKYIEEVGTMNVFFVVDGKVVTPSLDGATLPGITRMSVIELLRSWNIEVEERLVSILEIAEYSKNGRLDEAFGTGTAAVISPIGELRWQNESMTINNNQIGSLSRRLYDVLTGIQWSKVPDEFGWTVEVKPRG